MKTTELNNMVKLLIQSTDNLQEFVNLTSPVDNWEKIDKNIKVPDYIGLKTEDCPSCFEPVRLIFDKFSTSNEKIKIICPHCDAGLLAKLEFTGYTSDIYLEEE